jgi:hypothetical protein
LKHQKNYQGLLVALRNYFSKDQNQGDSLARFGSVRELLKEREEREAEDSHLEKHEAEDVLFKKLDNEEEALDYLLDVAIKRFGYAARDVFGAVFDFDSTTEYFRGAFNMSFDDLKKAVTSLAHAANVCSDISHRIVAVSPVYSDSNPIGWVKWKTAFNSDWVATQILNELKTAEGIEIHQLIRFFRGIPEAGSMVGSLFEPLAHTTIPRTSGGSWPLIRMVSTATTPSNEPKFVVTLEASSDDVELDQRGRETINFKSVSTLSRLDEKNYYVPDASNFALFDSFMVDIDSSTRSATLWIMQMTKSQLHRGSAKCYLYVRSLIGILKNQLKEQRPPRKRTKVTPGQTSSKPVVNVRYVLVVPKDEPGNQEWQFPAGWNEACKTNDHRGDVYRLEI